MAKNETLHIRVNGEVKMQAEQILGVLGVSISEAVNMLLHQINLVGGLPFSVRIPVAPERVVVNRVVELYSKLDAGVKQIQEGKTVDADVVMSRLSDAYGI